jgi:hypothetical protein
MSGVVAAHGEVALALEDLVEAPLLRMEDFLWAEAQGTSYLRDIETTYLVNVSAGDSGCNWNSR